MYNPTNTATAFARTWAELSRFTGNARRADEYEQRFAENLHEIMCYRKEHMNELEF